MTHRSHPPIVTLGIAVYNEGAFLREALDNVLKQTYTHLELIIADNGSTDTTESICREYAAKHPRITYVRHPKNTGQQTNFNYLPRCATGTYFCWVSGHDLLDVDFVEKCVTVLEAHPHAVLAYPRTMNIRADGTPTREKVRPFDIRSMTPAARFREVMWRVDCNYVYGMFRLAPMLDSHLFRSVPAADRVFLAEMAIKGPFVAVDTFKYYRANRVGIQPEMEKRHRLMSYIFPHKTYTDAQLNGNRFYRQTLREFYRVAQDAHLSLFARTRTYLSIWLCSILKFHLFPFADQLSSLTKIMLPKPILQRLLRTMQ